MITLLVGMTGDLRQVQTYGELQCLAKMHGHCRLAKCCLLNGNLLRTLGSVPYCQEGL